MTIADPAFPTELDVADGLARVLGDRALFERMLRRFRADYQHGVAPIRSAFERGDLPLAHRLAHTLAGAAGMLSAPALHQRARALELALRPGDGGIDAALDAVAAALASLLPSIDRLLGAEESACRPPSAAAALPDRALVAHLADLLANGDGAAIDLLGQSAASLAATLGQARFHDLAEAVNEFDFEGALEALEKAADLKGNCGG